MTLSASAARVLHGHVPSEIRLGQLAPVGRPDPAQRLHLAIGLPLHNQEALTNLLNELYDPNSPRYHQYLSPEQFTETFGPSTADYSAVGAFAESNGFTLTHLHGNRLLLDVDAKVADIERALHITLRLYPHPTEPRLFYAPDAEPWIEDSVPILDISGLDNLHIPKPLVHKLPQDSGAKAPQPLYGSGPGGTYRGGDFRAAYAPGVAATGIGQAVGLVEFDGYYASDITSYETQAGLPNVPLNNVLLDSFNGTPGSANIEVALDIEVAIAMASGLSQVIVYEAGPSGLPNDILNRMATDNLAKSLSSSWTWSGGPDSTTDGIFKQMASQGQSFFQAAGDDGAYTGAVSQPADDPYITIVGGTTLSTTGPGGAWSSEKTWNWYNSGTGTNGTGGGVSTSYAIPSWQQTVSMSANSGSTSMRNFPDVALTADNVWVAYNGGTSGAVGGTSCAAPLWAGFTALMNQQSVANGKGAVGFLNPAIYGIGQSNSYSTAFHDITTGNNTNNNSPNNFYAVSGFDLCTGWGTPAGSGLINALAGPAVAQVASNSLVLIAETCTNNAVDPGETVTMNFGLINTGTANTTNLVATLQAGGGVTSPSGPQTYGVLAAGGGSIAMPFTFTASGSCGSVITATLQLQDGASSLGTIAFTIRLGAAVVLTTFSENFDSVTAPSLPSSWSSTVDSGFLTVWVTTNGFYSSANNSVFTPDAGTGGQTELDSPVIPIVSSSAQLSFVQNYNLAAHTSHSRTTFYNGGILQISIGGGPFSDILSAGGSFVSGGYNCTLATGTGNPLGGAQAWGGSSGGWVPATVSLPAAAAGQNIQLKWVFGTGVNSYAGAGWFVDSLSVQDQSYTCCSPNADVGVNQSTAPNPGAVGQNLTYTISITNAGPSGAANLAVTDSLPSSVTLVSASPGCINLGGSIACMIGSLAAGGNSNILVTVMPSAEGTLTNSVSVSATTPDPNLANNYSVNTNQVYIPPSITAQPTNQVTTAGGSAAFYVSATGSSPLGYQWTFGGAALSGATSSALALANVQANQAGNYSVIVTNPAGSVTSVVATLSVLVPPSISQQPTNQTVVAGGNCNFQVQAAGSTPLSYQWLFNGAVLSGSTASTLALISVQTNQAGNYSVVVTNNVGSLTSAVATLTVLVPPSIALQPTNLTVVAGNSATFQGGATGSTPLSYQWLSGGNALAGATAAALTLTNVQAAQAGNYSFVVTNAAGAATSAVAQLTVLLPPSITTQPTNETVLLGGNTNLQVSASGTSPLSYQWWFDATNAVGSNTNTLSITNAQPGQAGNYFVIVTNAAGAATSAVAVVTVGTPPGINQQPTNLVVVAGQSAGFFLSATGDAPLNYQWYFNGTAIGSASASTYVIPAVSPLNAGNYDAVVSNAYGSATSVVAQLTVLVPPTITTQPTNQTVAAGSNVLFQVSAAGTSPLNYQWWFNATNAVGTNGSTIAVLNAQSAQAGAYLVVVSNSAGSVTSTVATLTIGTPPAIVQQPKSLTVVLGQGASFSVGASGDTPLGYQWRFDGAPIAGATATNYQINGATSLNAGNYDIVVTNNYGTATSIVAQLTVLVPPAITSEPTNQTVAAGSNVLFQVTASGTSPLSYQWWFNGTNAVGTNGNVLAVTNAQTAQAGPYLVVVSNSAGSVTSTVATLTIGTPPAITQQPGSLTMVEGQNAVFSVGASGDAPLSYQWRFDASPVGGATNSAFTVVGVTPASAGNYDVLVGNAYGALTSAVAQLTVLAPPGVSSDPTNQTTIAGAAVSFQVAASGSAPLSYQWWFNGTNAVGTSTNVLTLTNAQPALAGGYNVVITNAAGSVTSTVATLTVFVPPSISNQPSNQSIIAGGTANFVITASGTAPLAYQWLFDGTNAVGASTNWLTVSNALAGQAGAYSVVISNVAGSVTSTLAMLTVAYPPSIVTQPTNQVSSTGGTASFYAAASGTAPLSYQWTFNGSALPNANSAFLVLTNVQVGQAGSYALVVTNVAGSVTSAPASLAVLVPPSINAPLTIGSNFSVPVSSENGLSYLLEYKNTLEDPTWSPASSWQPGTGGLLMLQDTNSPVGTRFYRVRCQ